MHTHTHTYIYIYKCLYVCMCIGVCLYAIIYMYVCTWFWMCRYLHMCTCLFMCEFVREMYASICVHVCGCMCIYINIYIFIYMYGYVYICIWVYMLYGLSVCWPRYSWTRDLPETVLKLAFQIQLRSSSPVVRWLQWPLLSGKPRRQTPLATQTADFRQQWTWQNQIYKYIYTQHI